MSPERVFQSLTAIGLIAGGWLYGDYWKKSGNFEGGSEELAQLRARNTELTLTIDELENDLAQVRSMLTKGPFPVPDDLVAWVEKDYGMVFLKAPNVRLASPADMRNAAESNLRLIHGESGLEMENIAWELIGLIPNDQRLTGLWIMLETTGTRGIFDLTKEQILLAETYDPESIPDSSVLASLLAQQLSFQNHPREKWANRDEWQAWQATHVGAAASLQSRYNRRQSASNEAEFKDPESEREELLMALPPAIQGFANFPFVDGNDYARHFYIDSREAWSAMFRTPAQNTASIINPGNPHPSVAGLTLEPTSEEVLGENCLGELGLRLWLEPYLGNETASKLAEMWTNDRYRLTGSAQNISLIWQIEMTHASAAAELAREVNFSMLAHFQETQPTRQIKIEAQGSRFILSNQPKSQ
ncbi:hypothetical protein V2O64_18230 [Verrucomicrobiaceae bacterium 227]